MRKKGIRPATIARLENLWEGIYAIMTKHGSMNYENFRVLARHVHVNVGYIRELLALGLLRKDKTIYTLCDSSPSRLPDRMVIAIIESLRQRAAKLTERRIAKRNGTFVETPVAAPSQFISTEDDGFELKIPLQDHIIVTVGREFIRRFPLMALDMLKDRVK